MEEVEKKEIRTAIKYLKYCKKNGYNVHKKASFKSFQKHLLQVKKIKKAIKNACFYGGGLVAIEFAFYLAMTCSIWTW